jgi:hypothetical protein
MTETEKAYIAGIIDGEGYVTLAKMKNKASRKGHYYAPKIVIGNTNEEVIRWLEEKVGAGSIGCHKRKNRWKKLWVWTVWSKQAISLLEEVKEYLIIKKEQTEVLLDMPSNNPGRKISDKQWETYDEAYGKLRKLNERKAA